MGALRPSKGVLALAIALATLAFGGPAPAVANRGWEVVTANVTKKVIGPQGTIGTATAHCPAGTRAISGGYDSTHRSGALLVHSSMRTGTSSWRVSAYKVGSGATERLTAVAKCSADLGSVTTASKQTVVPAPPGRFALRTATANCPGNRFALSGGFRISVNGRATPTSPHSPPVAVILGSRSIARSWAVTAARLVSTGKSRMAAYAYCTSNRPFSRAISAIFPAGDRPQRLTTPTCPRGMAAASGGFLAHFPMGAAPGVMIPITSGPAGTRRWTATGLPQNANSFFSGYAYCL